MIYRIFAILTVAAVIIGSLLLARQEGAPQSLAVPQSDSGDGYSAQDAELIETGPSGLPLYTADAAVIRQLPHENEVELSQVKLGFQDESGNQWTATADRGAILRGTGRVSLSGHVQVSAALKGASAPVVITTETLSFESRTGLISTTDPVALQWSGQQLAARGLIANLKTHRLQLESSVHAIVSPSH